MSVSEALPCLRRFQPLPVTVQPRQEKPQMTQMAQKKQPPKRLVKRDGILPHTAAKGLGVSFRPGGQPLWASLLPHRRRAEPLP